MNYNNVKFKGNFRSYQQRILDSADLYLTDGKINIVAAPGSGKTILGLELIRRLGKPCIILSPTTTIRDQWGERFKESFLPDDYNINEYVNYDLNKIVLINSITYQALYSAMNRISSSSGDEIVDYSNIDLFKLIKEKEIKTICLHEAHHLQNEWQKALEDSYQDIVNRNDELINITEEYNNRLQDTINKTNEELTQLTELTKKYQGLREEILASIDEVLKYIEILDQAKNEIETEGGIHASGTETEEVEMANGFKMDWTPVKLEIQEPHTNAYETEKLKSVYFLWHMVKYTHENNCCV